MQIVTIHLVISGITVKQIILYGLIRKIAVYILTIKYKLKNLDCEDINWESVFKVSHWIYTD